MVTADVLEQLGHGALDHSPLGVHKDHRDAGALPLVLELDLAQRDVELTPQPLKQRREHPALVLERRALGDVAVDFEQTDRQVAPEMVRRCA